MIENKIILNQEKEKIFVEVYTPEITKSTIVFCHGITGCRKGRHTGDSYFQELAKKLMLYNYKVILFDFSGHGDSEGNDYDVTLSKSESELKTIVMSEVADLKNISFLAFSYGAAVLDSFLCNNPSIVPNKIILYSPCIFPLESCFLNSDSIFGKDIVKAFENGSLKNDGYTVVGAKNFKFGYKMIEECQNYNVSTLQKFNDRLLVLFGSNDVILNTDFNETFCDKYSIRKKYYDASHSLYEDIINVMEDTLVFFESN